MKDPIAQRSCGCLMLGNVPGQGWEHPGAQEGSLPTAGVPVWMVSKVPSDPNIPWGGCSLPELPKNSPPSGTRGISQGGCYSLHIPPLWEPQEFPLGLFQIHLSSGWQQLWELPDTAGTRQDRRPPAPPPWLLQGTFPPGSCCLLQPKLQLKALQASNATPLIQESSWAGFFGRFNPGKVTFPGSFHAECHIDWDSQSIKGKKNLKISK